VAGNAVLRDLAERLGISERALRDRLKRLRSRGRSSADAGGPREAEYPPEEKWLLETLLAEPALVEKAAAGVSPQDLESRDLAAVLEAVYEAFRSGGEVRASSIASAVGEAGLGSLVVSLAEKGARIGGHEKRLSDCIGKIENRKRRETRAHLKQRLLEKAREGDKQAEDSLLREFHKGLKHST